MRSVKIKEKIVNDSVKYNDELVELPIKMKYDSIKKQNFIGIRGGTVSIKNVPSDISFAINRKPNVVV